MFPFEIIVKVSNDPSFDDPTKSDPKCLKRLEAIVKKQGLFYRETGLMPPCRFRDRNPLHFEYRLYEGRTTASSYEAIKFDFFPKEHDLRIYSNIPETKATPIVNYIAKHYLKVQLIKDVSVSGKKSIKKAIPHVATSQDATTDEHGELKVTILKSPQLDEIQNTLKDVVSAMRPPHHDRSDIIALVRDIYTAKIKGITSYPKATEYVRRTATEDDIKFYERCVWARTYASSHAKNTKDGLNQFWTSIAQAAKPSADKQRAKAKSKGKPKITPTLYN